MNELKMTAEMARLPGADLVTAGKIYDPHGSNTYYSARTVAELLIAERERCVKLVEDCDVSGHKGYIETTGDLLEALAYCIRHRA